MYIAARASPTAVRFSIVIAEDTRLRQMRTVSSVTVDAGAWHHVLASLQEPMLRLWVDGVRTELADLQLDAPLGLDVLRLGGDGATAYDGALDEIWITQTAIASDDAVLARYCPL